MAIRAILQGTHLSKDNGSDMAGIRGIVMGNRAHRRNHGYQGVIYDSDRPRINEEDGPMKKGERRQLQRLYCVSE